jgi:Tfp pilus assembly protein PilN
MIKINLLAEKKPGKPAATASLKPEGVGGGQNMLLVGILLIGLVVAGGWWYVLRSETANWQRKHTEADVELERLKEIRAKGEEYERQKELLTRKIALITDLKKMQTVPVHILDQVSKNLPDFLWLESMSAAANQISITGKATTYNAVSNFYSNLSESGHFGEVALGRTFEVPEGVAFSLTSQFRAPGTEAPSTETEEVSN